MVDRCVCLDITFSDLKRRHKTEGLDLESLKKETGCCTGCTSCEPYVRLMLKTGRTRFAVLSPQQTAEAMRAG